MKDTIKFRLETKKDFSQTENVVREAFWNQFQPGCVEHYLLHVMRDSPNFLPELDFVAVDDDRIVGQIAYMKNRIETDDGQQIEVVGIGPIGVLPEYEGQGIGTALIEMTKQIVAEMGYPAIFLFGDPDFYSQVSFVPAKHFEIRTSDNTFAVAHQVLVLDNEKMSHLTGKYIEDPIYQVKEDDVEKFDQNFPAKEKIVGIRSQKKIEMLLKMVEKY
jgi:predicted N-acetyltransferase YhbS